MVEKTEKWKDGTIRMVYRDSKGRFVKSGNLKFYTGQKVGFWTKEPKDKIVDKIKHEDYIEGGFYRASVSLNIPYHGTRSKPNYKNFTYVVIDEKDKISIDDMKEELIEHIEKFLHYPRKEFWFGYNSEDFDIQYPKSYSSNYASKSFEGGES